jgi:hypothetical protein
MAKSPAERLRKAERRLAKAQRKAVRARKAAAPVVRLAGPPRLPAPDLYDEALLTQATGGDEVAAGLLQKRGTAGVFVSYARHVLATCHEQGQRAYASGVLAALDDGFDELGRCRGPGSAHGEAAGPRGGGCGRVGAAAQGGGRGAPPRRVRHPRRARD